MGVGGIVLPDLVRDRLRGPLIALLACGLLAATLGTLALSFQAVRQLAASPALSAQAGAVQDGEAYSPPRLAALRQQGKPVFINLTAAWCITCLVNEKVALSQPEFKQLLQQEGITYMKGDWTNQDAQISALLKQYGRSGVPLYLFYPSGAGSEARVLPQILTHDIVSAALRSH